ncbi:hypothetical protein PanWU01x14_307620, partial [Parasponia andersonii]
VRLSPEPKQSEIRCDRAGVNTIVKTRGQNAASLWSVFFIPSEPKLRVSNQQGSLDLHHFETPAGEFFSILLLCLSLCKLETGVDEALFMGKHATWYLGEQKNYPHRPRLYYHN